MRRYRVFSVDIDGRETPLTDYMSDYRCQKWIDNMARAGRPTHFYLISSLTSDEATRRYGI